MSITPFSNDSSLKVKDSSGQWVEADEYNVSNRARLLEAEDSILGKLFLPIRNKVKSTNLSLTEKENLILQAETLCNKNNLLLTEGLRILFGSNKKDFIDIIKKRPCDFPIVAPYLLRREDPSTREKILLQLLSCPTSTELKIDTARLMGTNVGAQFLIDNINHRLASISLAMLNPNELQQKTLISAQELTSQFPELWSLCTDKSKVTPPAQGINIKSDQFCALQTSIEHSLLIDGVVFNGRRNTINLYDSTEFYAAICAVRPYIVESMRARSMHAGIGLPEDRLRKNFTNLLTPNGLKEKLDYIKDIETYNLARLFNGSELDSRLINHLHLERIKVELRDNQGAFDEAFRKYLGRWQWIVEQSKTKSVEEILIELKAYSLPDTPLPVGELVGTRGKLQTEREDPINSIDCICSVLGNEEHFFEILQSEKRSLLLGLPSIGVEIQNLSIPDEDFYMWKDFLISHGIQSSWRPEFGTTVEASLPPFHDLNNLKTVLTFLYEKGFFNNSTKGMAVHISVGSEISPDFSFIALCLFGCSSPSMMPEASEDEWLLSLRNVLSKGFIYNNPGSYSVHPDCPSKKTHTEIRTFSVPANEESQTILNAIFTVLEKVQKLTLLMRTEEFESFKENVLNIERQTGTGLLEHDWAFGTGDPESIETLKELPFVKALIAFRRWGIQDPIRLNDFYRSLENLLLD